MISPALKICTCCQRELPATREYFHRHCRTKDGLQSRCKACLLNRLPAPLYDPPLKQRICIRCRQPFIGVIRTCEKCWNDETFIKTEYRVVMG